MFEFDSGTHSYTLDGDRLPGVTAVLKMAGVLQAYGDDFARDRGSKVHRMIRNYFDGQLDEDRLPEWMVPYHTGLVNFVQQTGFKPQAWEVPVFDHIHRYAGTPDVIGTFPAHRLPSIVDFKTGPIASWTKIQTAAYTRNKPFNRAAVGLGEGLNGGLNYNCKVYGLDTLANHMRVFYASLTIANFLHVEKGVEF